MSNKAIFLDRDGTINIDTGYIGSPDLIELYPGVSEGIKILKNQLGYKIIVISNQSGIARGLISTNDVERVNERINFLLTINSAKIDSFYYCPYHPDFSSEKDCSCRKPSPKMVLEAAKDFQIDLNKSFFFGDKASDVACGKRAGVKTILIKNSISDAEINELINSQNSPNFIASNFLDAVKFVEENTDGDLIA